MTLRAHRRPFAAGPRYHVVPIHQRPAATSEAPREGFAAESAKEWVLSMPPPRAQLGQVTFVKVAECVAPPESVLERVARFQRVYDHTESDARAARPTCTQHPRRALVLANRSLRAAGVARSVELSRQAQLEIHGSRCDIQATAGRAAHNDRTKLFSPMVSAIPA